MTQSIAFLDEAAVSRLLRYEDLIPAVAKALADLSLGKVVQPVRSVLPIADHRGFFAVMPAYAGVSSPLSALAERGTEPAPSGARGGEAMGAKLVTFYPHNQGIHTHHAVIVLFKPETGEPLAMMDGRLITEMRTAAASAAATQQLARANASTLGVLGSGVQAASHLAAIRHVRPVKEVRVWSPRHAQDFAARHGVQAVATAEDAVRGADIVVVATSAQSPVLQGAWLSPGAHVNAVGATRPTWRELDDDLMGCARVFVDSKDAATKEAGDVIAARQEVVEIGSVIAGKADGRRNDTEITVFKSVGVAVEDVVSANLVYAAHEHAHRT